MQPDDNYNSINENHKGQLLPESNDNTNQTIDKSKENITTINSMSHTPCTHYQQLPTTNNHTPNSKSIVDNNVEYNNNSSDSLFANIQSNNNTTYSKEISTLPYTKEYININSPVEKDTNYNGYSFNSPFTY